MSWKLLAVSLSLGLAACTAMADETRPSGRCEINDSKPDVCRMSDTVAADGTHTMVFITGQQRIEFVGRSQTGWWSGKLEGEAGDGARDQSQPHHVQHGRPEDDVRVEIEPGRPVIVQRLRPPGAASGGQARRNTFIGEVRAMRSVPVQPARATTSAAPTTTSESSPSGGR